MKVKVLYACKIGQPNYMADILTEKEEEFEKATAWAKANGFDRIRIQVIDLSTPPNFVNTINRKK